MGVGTLIAGKILVLCARHMQPPASSREGVGASSEWPASKCASSDCYTCVLLVSQDECAPRHTMGPAITQRLTQRPPEATRSHHLECSVFSNRTPAGKLLKGIALSTKLSFSPKPGARSRTCHRPRSVPRLTLTTHLPVALPASRRTQPGSSRPSCQENLPTALPVTTAAAKSSPGSKLLVACSLQAK